MSHTLSVELPEAVYSALASTAAEVGRTPAQHLAAVAEREYGSASSVGGTSPVGPDLLACIGMIHIVDPKGIDNELIDADLADDHDPEARPS